MCVSERSAYYISAFGTNLGRRLGSGSTGLVCGFIHDGIACHTHVPMRFGIGKKLTVKSMTERSALGSGTAASSARSRKSA